jgi:hypothetical protein
MDAMACRFRCRRRHAQRSRRNDDRVHLRGRQNASHAENIRVRVEAPGEKAAELRRLKLLNGLASPESREVFGGGPAVPEFVLIDQSRQRGSVNLTGKVAP